VKMQNIVVSRALTPAVLIKTDLLRM